MHDDRFVFNIVWTGDVFDHLQVFTASVLHQSEARFRFVANGCPPAQIAAMERFAALHPGRVVEVLDVSSPRMVPHGAALDTVFEQRDDGELFCFIDPDILAVAPFMPRFAEALDQHDAVTSGKEVWSETNVRPDGHAGVNGEYFYDRDGFVFGSPHLAIYRRGALDDTLGRWGVGFGSGGEHNISAEALRRIEEFGRAYWIYDTGKIVNILLQADGHTLTHAENPDLVHVGGVSHFLAPPMTPEGLAPVWGENQPDWGAWDGMADRFAVARFTADVITACFAGRPGPQLPDHVDATIRTRLEELQVVLEKVATEHGPGTARYVESSR